MNYCCRNERHIKCKNIFGAIYVTNNWSIMIELFI